MKIRQYCVHNLFLLPPSGQKNQLMQFWLQYLREISCVTSPPLCLYCLHSWSNTAVGLFLYQLPPQMLLHLGRPRLLSPVGSEATSQREQTETQTQQPQPVTQPNGILEFLKRLVSGSATTATADSLEASHGKHKHLPLKESHSTTVGKHDVQMRTRESYATRSPPTCSSAQLRSAQHRGLSYAVRFLSLPV